MNENIAIKVENLSKVYKLYNSHVDRLKESLSPFRKKYHHDFYALRDISLNIKKGESVGIIGHNGSGKSTLLKIITGVLTPTSGSVTVHGKISALLELGAGFNPELTGIENVYFNGTLMGYSREDMDENLDDILSFADIGEFVYQPVKTYSSGMFVRLAFALAINVDPEILIVDEALSVGDIKFQRKCYGKIEQFHDAKKTIIFVSHGLDTVNILCNSAYLLNGGVIIESGAPKKVTRIFQEMMLGKDVVRSGTNQVDAAPMQISHEMKQKKSAEKIALAQLNDAENLKLKNTIQEKLQSWNGNKKAEVIDCGILDTDGNRVTLLKARAKYTFFSRILIYEDLKKIHLGYPIKNAKGLFVFGVNSDIQQVNIPAQAKGDVLEGRVDVTMWLAPGDYFLSFGAGINEVNYDWLDDQIHFVVLGDCDLHPVSLVNLEPKVSVQNIILSE